MDFSKLTLVSMMQTKVAYLSERTDLLARNVANVDTPGYEARDLRPLDFERLAQAQARKLEVRATSPLHSGGTRAAADSFRDQEQRETFGEKPIDNNISLEEQMAMVSDTSMQYSEVINLYGKVNTLFTTAINNR